LRLSTTASTSWLPRPFKPSPRVRAPHYSLWAVLAAFLLGWLAFGPKVRQRRRALKFSLGLLAAVLIWQAACGGGGGGGAPPIQHVPGTPSGTYTITITASAGQLQHSLTATVTVR
jgi:hypothetical protein